MYSRDVAVSKLFRESYSRATPAITVKLRFMRLSMNLGQRLASIMPVWRPSLFFITVRWCLKRWRKGLKSKEIEIKIHASKSNQCFHSALCIMVITGMQTWQVSYRALARLFKNEGSYLETPGHEQRSYPASARYKSISPISNDRMGTHSLNTKPNEMRHISERARVYCLFIHAWHTAAITIKAEGLIDLVLSYAKGSI